MKKIIVGIAVIVMLLVGALVISRISLKKPVLKPTTSSFDFTVYAQQATVSATLQDGTTSLLQNGKAQYVSGTTIEVKKGTAEIRLRDNSLITLSEGAKTTILVKPQLTKIIQYAGDTWHRVLKLVGRSYQVETPTSVATVRGTKFGVFVLKNASRILSTEHTIGVQKRIVSESGEAQLGEEKLVTEGTEGEVHQEVDEVDVHEIPPEDKNTEWFQKNEERDKQFDEEEMRREIITPELKNDEIKNDETKKDENKRDEIRKVETKKDEIKVNEQKDLKIEEKRDGILPPPPPPPEEQLIPFERKDSVKGVSDERIERKKDPIKDVVDRDERIEREWRLKGKDL